MSALAPACCGMTGRNLIKGAAVLITVGYCSLLVYQGGAAFSYQGPRVQVSDLTIEPVTKNSIINESDTTKNITLEDLFISVKTTQHYQYTRLPIILKTWFQLAKEQIWFFTDTDNPQHQNQTNGHMINTNCTASHERNSLCCKMSVEYDYFLESNKKWFCHFDDDNYVNVPRLLTVLQRYNYKEDWYLGRTSVYEPVNFYIRSRYQFSFWFATGGAGICISRGLALKMSPIASGGRFIGICQRARYPDDVTMGFLIEAILHKKLTVVKGFHSHLEQMKLLKTETLKDQISLGYSKVHNEWNVVDVPGFDTRYDPTRYLTHNRHWRQKKYRTVLPALGYTLWTLRIVSHINIDIIIIDNYQPVSIAIIIVVPDNTREPKFTR